MSEEKTEKKAEVIPAATMVIFRNDPDGGAPLLLMVERVKQMRFAAGAAVFPGGRVDDADFAYADILDHGLDRDEAAARLAAMRETLEEAGLALGLKGADNKHDIEAARAQLHDGATLANICGKFGWVPDFDVMIPWARWMPPRGEIRTFDTRFYLVDAGDAQLDAQVDNTENSSLFWDNANAVLERAAKGEVKIIFPTRRNLERLALWGSFAEAHEHALTHPVKMTQTYVEDREDGKYLCIPDDMGYPITEESFESAMRG